MKIFIFFKTTLIAFLLITLAGAVHSSETKYFPPASDRVKTNIDISTFTNGLYIIKIQMDNNMIITKQVIKY